MRYTLITAAVLALGLSPFHARAGIIEDPLAATPAVDRGMLEQHALLLNDEIEALQNALELAIQTAHGDADKANAQMDIILAAFQPHLDDFINAYNRFHDGLLDNTPDTEARAVILAGRDESVLALKAMPQALREQALNPPPAAETKTH